MAGDKRKVILAAAEGLLRERWVHELKLDDVAAAAGIGKGTIYLHFRNKDDLLFQVAVEGFDDLCALVAASPDGGRGFEERLTLLCRHIGDFFDRRRSVLRLIQEHEGRFGGFNRPLRDRWLTHRRKLVKTVAGVLAAGVRGGALRKDVPAEDLAKLLLGMLRTRGRDYEGEPERRPVVDWIADMFIHGAARKLRGKN